MQTSSELITLLELVNELKDKSIVIPLLQRNYKWGIDGLYESEATAEKLLVDIQNAKEADKNEYTIGMVTLYVNNEEVQVIDGQQRMITLSLLAKALGEYNSFLHLKFQRDTDDKEREEFLQNNTSFDCVDVRHMKAACKMFSDKLECYCDDDKAEFFRWILDHVKLICRYTENEPLQEFLNLNEKKTAFSSTDYDRAFQLKYQAELKKITPAMIIKEHNEIEKYLYTNDDIFKLVSIRYPDVVNRMDLIFSKIKSNMKTLSEYYEKIDSSDDERDEKYERCYAYLVYCHNVLRSINQEIEQRDNSSLNVNIYNAVMMLYKMDSDFKFFDLIDIDDMDSKTFEQKVREQFNLLASSYGRNPSKNAFMQSQLLDVMSTGSNDKSAIPESAYKEAESYVTEEYLNIFEEKVNETEALIEKGKKYSKLVKGGKKSFEEILNISEIKQIIVPTIQRDYTFGCDGEKVKGLFFDISKTVLISSIGEFQEDAFPSGTAARVVFNSLKDSRLWDKPGYFGGRYSEIKSKPEYEFASYYKLCKMAGFSIYEVVHSWGYNEEKCTLNRLLQMLTDKLKLTEEDYENIKANKYFEKAGEEEFLFSVIFGYLDDGDFYLYDGQQRMVTLVYLCAFLINQSYAEETGETKEQVESYINLLRKFKFEERKEANDLLYRLLDVNNPISNLDVELKPYIIDHSTYSIVNLLKTYKEYENGYGKEIMSFDLEYIMKKVIFEFAVVKEASIADQMYMDLNSKNVSLTSYENYKAELVYILSTRFVEMYSADWKYQLDNLFLDKCYKEEKGWDKSQADDAEELEIKIIHWCFKMACMEYGGVSIGEITDAKKRLRWMEDSFADAVIQTAGNILNKKIFSESKYFNQVMDIVNNSEKVTEFCIDEFLLWFELRFTDHAISDYKIVKTNNYVKIYNWNKDNAKNDALYWICLSAHYQQEESNKLCKSDMVKFMLHKFHSFWMDGFLQAELLKNIEGFYNINDDNSTVDKEKIAAVSDYYSEKYLTEKPESISWLEYVYTVKLNEMLNVRKYELVKQWEKAEYERKEIFDSKEKKLAKEKAFGDYNLWRLVKENFTGDFNKSSPSISCKINSGDDVSNEVIKLIKEDDLRMSRIRKKILREETDLNITIQCADNPDIKDAVRNYIIKEIPGEFMSKIKNRYYIMTNGKTDSLYEFKNETHEWELTDTMKVGIVDISGIDFSEKFNLELKKATNSPENTVRFNWWAYKAEIFSQIDYKNTLNDQVYDIVLKVFEENEKNEFIEIYRNLVGVPPHD